MLMKSKLKNLDQTKSFWIDSRPFDLVNLEEVTIQTKNTCIFKVQVFDILRSYVPSVPIVKQQKVKVTKPLDRGCYFRGEREYVNHLRIVATILKRPDRCCKHHQV